MVNNQVSAPDVPGDEWWPAIGNSGWPNARKAFLKLWAAGTVGGFLAFLIRSFALDLAGGTPIGPGCTVDLVLRYLYLLWLIVYFFLSNLKLDYEAVTPGLVLYDLMQTICAFIAAFAFGFVMPGKGISCLRSALAFEIADVTIFLICLCAIPFGGGKVVKSLRVTGACISAGAFLVVERLPTGQLTAGGIALSYLAIISLLILLIPFGRQRVSELSAK